MLTVSQEDNNFETNFLIGKPLRIDHTLYVFENKIRKHYSLVPFIVAFLPVDPRPNFTRYYGNRIKFTKKIVGPLHFTFYDIF